MAVFFCLYYNTEVLDTCDFKINQICFFSIMHVFIYNSDAPTNACVWQHNVPDATENCFAGEQMWQIWQSKCRNIGSIAQGTLDWNIIVIFVGGDSVSCICNFKSISYVAKFIQIISWNWCSGENNYTFFQEYSHMSHGTCLLQEYHFGGLFTPVITNKINSLYLAYQTKMM